MGKLNFKDCNFFYDTAIFDLKPENDILKIFYDFTVMKKKDATIKIFLNTIFIQNLVLNFELDKKAAITLEIRMGEQNFTYKTISFDSLKKAKIALVDINPYTSAIYMTIKNNGTTGNITLKNRVEDNS